MVKYLFLCMVLLFAVPSCAVLGPPMSEMTEEDFELFSQEVYLLAKIGAKQLCQNDEEMKEKVLQLLEFVTPISESIDEKGVIHLSGFMSEVSSGLIDEDIEMALQLVMIRLKRSGAISFQEGTQVLTPRSAKLFNTVLNGLVAGCNS